MPNGKSMHLKKNKTLLKLYLTTLQSFTLNNAFFLQILMKDLDMTYRVKNVILINVSSRQGSCYQIPLYVCVQSNITQINLTSGLLTSVLSIWLHLPDKGLCKVTNKNSKRLDRCKTNKGM